MRPKRRRWRSAPALPSHPRLRGSLHWTTDGGRAVGGNENLETQIVQDETHKPPYRRVILHDEDAGGVVHGISLLTDVRYGRANGSPRICELPSRGGGRE